MASTDSPTDDATDEGYASRVADFAHRQAALLRRMGYREAASQTQQFADGHAAADRASDVSERYHAEVG